MTDLQFPLNDVQVSLLKLTQNLSDDEMLELKKLILAFKAQRLSQMTDALWEEKGWTEETLQAFLKEHMRTEYKKAI